MGLFGKSPAGPAKASCIASGVMGSISGSAISNVLVTGSFTIPMMKKSGLSSSFAAGVEAVASTGGYIFPPVMGAVAFLMAEILQVPYAKIVIHAIVPAVLFYLGIYLTISFRAKKQNIKPFHDANKISVKTVIMTRGHLFLPLVLLIYMIMNGYGAQYSAFWSCIFLIIISYLRKETRLTFRRLCKSFDDAAKTALSIGASMAAIGILVGLLNMTGIGLRISGLLVDISHGSFLILSVVTAITSLFLGMGMPSIPLYILVSTTVVPALVELGTNPIVGHFFVFYYGSLANITPPVCVAAYAAASVAKADPIRTGFDAVIIGLTAFILPMIFLYNPTLLLIEPYNFIEIGATIGFTITGIFALTAFTVGYLLGQLNWFARLLMAGSALLLFIPYLKLNVCGLALLLALALHNMIAHKKKYRYRNTNDKVFGDV
jgi:TRAP transporter 4TM/12TM fusion protein